MLSICHGKRRTSQTLPLLALLLLTVLSTATNAIEWHGYGSVRVGQFTRGGQDAAIPELYRGSSAVSFSEETLFGLQMQQDLADNWQLVAQWQARGNRDFSIETNLLFLRWHLHETWQLKVGRLNVPLFAQSDSQYIGYSHDYARLPKSVYWRFNFETGDGIALEHQQNWDWATLKTQLQWSQFDGVLFKSAGTGIDGKLENSRLVRFNLETSQWDWVAGAMRTTIDSQQLDQQFSAAFSPSLQKLGASASQIRDFFFDTRFSRPGTYWYYGSRFHPGAWKFEYERVRYGINDSIDGKTSAWFGAVSRRIDDWVVTLHHEEMAKRPRPPHQVLRAGTPSEFYPVTTAMVSALNQRFVRFTGLSLRYDVAPNMALKADYYLGDVVSVVDANAQAAHGFSMGVDFVF